jgi:hypothetical protein
MNAAPTELDHFYEIHVRHAGYEDSIFWRSPLLLPSSEVPAAAVKDKMMPEFELLCVEYVLEITQEEYLHYMWE